MDHLQQLRWYGQEKEARIKLMLVAKYIDNPDKLKKFEDEWLYGIDHTNPPWNNWFFD